jgi:hypothetical protein
MYPSDQLYKVCPKTPEISAMRRIIPYVLAAVIGFGAGHISSCNGKYSFKEKEGKEYLCKKGTGQCEQLTEDFQLGSLEYRLDGIKKQILGLELVENGQRYQR